MSVAIKAAPAYTVFNVTPITTAVDKMVDGLLSFEAACAVVRDYRAAEALDTDTAREMIQAALVAKKAVYATQLTANGKPQQDSALQKAVSRLMKATNPDNAEGSGQKADKQELDVPADIAALAAKLVKLCNEYEGAKKLASTAVAQAFAAAK